MKKRIKRSLISFVILINSFFLRKSITAIMVALLIIASSFFNIRIEAQNYRIRFEIIQNEANASIILSATAVAIITAVVKYGTATAKVLFYTAATASAVYLGNEVWNLMADTGNYVELNETRINELAVEYVNNASPAQLANLQRVHDIAMANGGAINLSHRDLNTLGIFQTSTFLNDFVIINRARTVTTIPSSEGLDNEGLINVLTNNAGLNLVEAETAVQRLNNHNNISGVIRPRLSYLLIYSFGTGVITGSHSWHGHGHLVGEPAFPVGYTSTQFWNYTPYISLFTANNVFIEGTTPFIAGNLFQPFTFDLWGADYTSITRANHFPVLRGGVMRSTMGPFFAGDYRVNVPYILIDPTTFEFLMDTQYVIGRFPLTSVQFHKIADTIEIERFASEDIPLTFPETGITIPNITQVGTPYTVSTFDLPLVFSDVLPEAGVANPDLTEINARIDELEARVTTVQTETNNAFLTLHASVNAGFAALQGNVLGINEGIQGLNDRIGGLEIGIGNVNTGIQGLNNLIGGLETGIGNINTGIQGIQTDITGVNQGIQGIDQRLDNLEGTITGGLSGVISAINALPATLSTAIIGDFSKINFNAFFEAGLLMTDRFPFSIPWDFQNLINMLNVAPRAPVFEFDFSGTVFEGFNFRLDLYELSSVTILGNATLYMLVNTIRHILTAFFVNVLIILTMKIFK